MLPLLCARRSSSAGPRSSAVSRSIGQPLWAAYQAIAVSAWGARRRATSARPSSRIRQLRRLAPRFPGAIHGLLDRAVDLGRHGARRVRPIRRRQADGLWGRRGHLAVRVTDLDLGGAGPRRPDDADAKTGDADLPPPGPKI